MLYVVLALTALLGANSVYLISITALEWLAKRFVWERQIFQDYFYQYMFLVHLAVGLLLVGPFVVFGLVHLWTTRNRKNRRAVRVGYVLFLSSLVALVTGVLLMRVGGFDLKQPLVRSVVYWLHVITPLACVWLYWLHRLAGPRIKWRIGLGYTAAMAALVLADGGHARPGSAPLVRSAFAGRRKYFQPSLAKTATGDFIPPQTMMMDSYCQKCHGDVYEGWFHSSHHFSSFNNPAYLASVRETRQVSLKRDGTVRAARWCAGCHDPVPFLSGAFDRPDYDDVGDPTAQAGITCTACHAITSVDSTRGNGDYTIEEPIHYPFAFSDNPVLQWVNNQLVKAKPSFHKKTFLKDVHRSAEFCSSCHKVHLPMDVTQYKDFLRGQNHYDPYLLSGVSGHGARSFYYPDQAKTRCAECHMPLAASNDFGAKAGEKFFEDAKELSVHSHLFPAANTALPVLAQRTEDRRRPAEVPRRRDARRRVRRQGRRRDRRPAGGPAAAPGTDARARPAVLAGSRRAHAEDGASVHPGHRGLERSLAGRDRHERRSRDRPQRGDRRLRRGRPLGQLHERVHAGP